ncbi:uncharacterized protein BDR25DRAFT_348100 [Lindgomyces ingoldianus]|uniref:Uncharacterized protein n=1 Tax=Lindgomyces ingoldianus TaxID=673940 RepID=A0ACB6RF04_9PLEO|nr:uncharacterized protein BDR25DRAFT_348100 [Lindgomyces ingoldianus]KAF2477781.1 hypothetical protein BDR25DRAFT_348100 [Lindgomyces ingoldianus]
MGNDHSIAMRQGTQGRGIIGCGMSSPGLLSMTAAKAEPMPHGGQNIRHVEASVNALADGTRLCWYCFRCLCCLCPQSKGSIFALLGACPKRVLNPDSNIECCFIDTAINVPRTVWRRHGAGCGDSNISHEMLIIRTVGSIRIGDMSYSYRVMNDCLRNRETTISSPLSSFYPTAS